MDPDYTNIAGGENVYVPSRLPQDQVRAVFRQLENNLWFAPETVKIEITFVTYHAEQDILVVTHIWFILNTGGHIHKKIEPATVKLHPYRNPWSYVVDIAWVALLLRRFLSESYEVWQHWRQLGFCKGSYEYLDMSNGVDWTSIIYAVVIIILWAIHVGNIAKLEEILTKGDARFPGTFADLGIREDFYNMVDTIVHEDHVLRTVVAAYPFVTMARFFKACASQPRLALVTTTFAKAFTSIFHFGVVFFTVFIVFAAAAVILWGEENADFSNFMRALNTTFRLLLGDFDWEELHEIGRPQAIIWFWAFNWLVNLIMLNMLLAIILDHYGEVKAGIGRAATLWGQTQEILDRWNKVRRGQAMSLGEVLNRLDPTALDEDDNESDEQIYVETLVKIHGLSDKQAFEILLEAQTLRDQEALLEDDADVADHLQVIARKVTQMHRFMETNLRNQHFQGSSDLPATHLDDDPVAHPPSSTPAQPDVRVTVGLPQS